MGTTILVDKNTVHQLNLWLEDKEISKKGLLAELALALAMGGESRFFRIECKDLQGLSDLHPSRAKTWGQVVDVIRELSEEGYEGKELSEKAKEAGLTANQLKAALKQLSRV